MNRTILTALVVLSLAFPVMAAIYAPTHTFVPGEQIKSSLFNQMQTDIGLACGEKAIVAGQLGDSCVETSKLGADCVGNFAMQDGSVKAEQLNYTDSGLWDTMPARYISGRYTGDSTATRRIDVGGLRPMSVEVTSYSATGACQFVFDVRWDTTQALVTHLGSSTMKFIGSTVSATKGDTEFVVNHQEGIATDTDANYLGRVYLWRVFGY